MSNDLEQEIKDILQNYPLNNLQLLNYVESTKTLYLIYREESNEHRSIEAGAGNLGTNTGGM